MFTWESLVDQTFQLPENHLNNYSDLNQFSQPPDHSNSQVYQFKKQFVLVVILTECIERFIFGKISHVVFSCLVNGRFQPHPTNKTTDMGLPIGWLFTRILSPFSLSADSSKSSSSENRPSQELNNLESRGKQSAIDRESQQSGQSSPVGTDDDHDNVPNSPLTHAIARLKSSLLFRSDRKLSDSPTRSLSISENTFDVYGDLTDESRRAINFVRKRLNRLNTMIVSWV